jgi:hypothetical protein
MTSQTYKVLILCQVEEQVLETYSMPSSNCKGIELLTYDVIDNRERVQTTSNFILYLTDTELKNNLIAAFGAM